MRFELTEHFKSDFRRLSKREQAKFREAVRLFNEGCDQFVVSKQATSWPGQLRVKPVINARGVFEMTWSFSGPDGRATWEWTTATDEDGVSVPAVRWRRLGGHAIFKSP